VLLGPVVAFVATTQADAAEHFYADVLGLRRVSRDPYAVVFDNDGTMLRVAVVEQFQPQPFTVLGWQVANIETAVEELASRGVIFNRYEFIPQNELGIWSTPDGARVAWFKDPDGNTLSLTQF
jgi:catechol 2,3-dioxygenase-like lactoylglutathione lyase family enzyme